MAGAGICIMGIPMSESAKRARRDGPAASLIAVVEMVSGLVAAIYVLASSLTTSVVRAASFVRVQSNIAALSVVVALLFVATAYAGWRLWKGDRLGYRLSAVLLAVQVVRVALPGAQFEISCPISLGLGWVPDVGPALVTGYGLSFWLGTLPTVAQSCVSVNGVALLAVLYLLVRAPRVARSGDAVSAKASIESGSPSAHRMMP
jgi:hypothetical protein